MLGMKWVVDNIQAVIIIAAVSISQRDFWSHRGVLIWLEVISWSILLLGLSVLVSFIRYPRLWLSELCVGGILLLTFGIVAKIIIVNICHSGTFAWSGINTTSACGRIMACEMLCFFNGLSWLLDGMFSYVWA